MLLRNDLRVKRKAGSSILSRSTTATIRTGGEFHRYRFNLSKTHMPP